MSPEPQLASTADRLHQVSGADRLVKTLKALDVEVAFGLPGVHNLPIWQALARSAIRLVTVRHEQAAVYAADGYARTSGRLGVALVTTGPGAANTLGATGEAMASGTPVLVIATDISSHLRMPGLYRGALHETRDQAGMFAPVTKSTVGVAFADDIATEVANAARVALAAPSGPVYVGVPTDMLSVDAGPGTLGRPHAQPALPSAHDLDAAAQLVQEAERPLIWAGGGALRGDASAAVANLAERLAAPVLTTFGARGLLPPSHPCLAPASVHEPEVGRLWDDADLVVAIGSDLDGMSTQNWALPVPPRLLAVNIDAADAGKNYRADMVLVGETRTTTDGLAARVPQRNGLAELERRLHKIDRELRERVAREDPAALELLDGIRSIVPDDAVLVLDMCIPGYWLGGHHRPAAPRRLIYPVGWGTLGFAFPASLGASLGGLGRAVCVCGDGGFLFACGELATAAQERLALTVILVDDGGYGMLRYDQQRAGQARFGVDLRTPDFVKLAHSFGVAAVRVEGFGATFRTSLRQSLASDEPNMVVVSATLRPPGTTSPRWYRRPRADSSPGPSNDQRQQ